VRVSASVSSEERARLKGVKPMPHFFSRSEVRAQAVLALVRRVAIDRAVEMLI
jgi:hypothetical protein